MASMNAQAMQWRYPGLAMAAQRVRIGTCHGPADASLVRSMLAAHDIDAVVNGEQHASMLGGLGGALIQLDIWVSADDADQASALLRELRDGTHTPPDDDAAATTTDDNDDEVEAAADWQSASSFEAQIDKRRRLGVVLLLAFCITFGTAHMYMGAWAMGLVLAAVELAAITQLGEHPGLGASVLAAVIVVDAIGAILRVNALGRAKLPVARAL